MLGGFLIRSPIKGITAAHINVIKRLYTKCGLVLIIKGTSKSEFLIICSAVLIKTSQLKKKKDLPGF
jgi:hypothetical protein